MRWIENNIIPIDGDTKISQKFAWLPTKIHNDIVVWLESYTIRSIYSDQHGQWLIIKKF